MSILKVTYSTFFKFCAPSVCFPEWRLIGPLDIIEIYLKASLHSDRIQPNQIQSRILTLVLSGN